MGASERVLLRTGGVFAIAILLCLLCFSSAGAAQMYSCKYVSETVGSCDGLTNCECITTSGKEKVRLPVIKMFSTSGFGEITTCTYQNLTCDSLDTKELNPGEIILFRTDSVDYGDCADDYSYWSSVNVKHVYDYRCTKYENTFFLRDKLGTFIKLDINNVTYTSTKTDHGDYDTYTRNITGFFTVPDSLIPADYTIYFGFPYRYRYDYEKYRNGVLDDSYETEWHGENNEISTTIKIRDGNDWSDYISKIGYIHPDNIFWKISSGNWRASPMPVSDATRIYNRSGYYWEDGYDMVYNYGERPYNGKDTSFKKIIYSDTNKSVILNFADANKPTGTFNSASMNLRNAEGDYWNYRATVDLKEGVNDFIYNSKSDDFNIFDYKIYDNNQPIKIENVKSSENYFTGEELSFDVSVSGGIYTMKTETVFDGKHYRTISTTEKLIKVTMYVDEPSEGALFSAEANGSEIYFDSYDEQEYYKLNDGSTAVLPLDYTAGEEGAYKITFVAEDLISGNTNIQIIDFNVGEFQTLTISDIRMSGEPYTEKNIGFEVDVKSDYPRIDAEVSMLIDDPNPGTEYVKEFYKEVSFCEGLDNCTCYDPCAGRTGCFKPMSTSCKQVVETIGYDYIISHNRDSGTFTTFSDGDYVSAVTDTFVYTPESEGTYTITFAANDEARADLTYIQMSMDVSSGNSSGQVFGFFPMAGEGSESGSGGKAFAAVTLGFAAVGALAGAAVLGAKYISSSPSVKINKSYRTLSSSVKKMENAFSMLDRSSYANSQSQKGNLFSQVYNKLFEKNQKLLAEEAQKKAEDDKIKKENEEIRAKQKAQKDAVKNQFFAMLNSALYSGQTIKQKYQALKSYFNRNRTKMGNVNLSEFYKLEKFNKDAEAGVDYSTWKGVGGWANMEKQGQSIREKIGNKFTVGELQEMGFVNYVDGNMIFDEKGYEEFVNPPKEIPQVSFGVRAPYSILYEQKTAWEKITGTAWGFLKYGAINQQRKTNTLKGVFSELINGNISGALSIGMQYTKEEIGVVFNGIKNNLEIIAGAAVAGAGVALLAGTVGISTPISVALIAAGGAMMFNNIRYRYAEPLNEINDFYDIDFNTMETRFLDNTYAMEGYWKIKENLVGDTAAVATGIGSYYGTAGLVNPLIWRYNYGVDTSKLAFNQKVTLTNQWGQWREGLFKLNEFSNVNKISIVPGENIGYWGRQFNNGNVRLNFELFSKCPEALTVVSSHEAIENIVGDKLYRYVPAGRDGYLEYGYQETIIESINQQYLGKEAFRKGFVESVKMDTANLKIELNKGLTSLPDPFVELHAKNLAILKNIDSVAYKELNNVLSGFKNYEMIISKTGQYNTVFNNDWTFLMGGAEYA